MKSQSSPKAKKITSVSSKRKSKASAKTQLKPKSGEKKKEEEKAAKTILDDFVDAAQAIANSIELGILKLWQVKGGKPGEMIEASEFPDAGKLHTIKVKIDERGSRVLIGFSNLECNYVPEVLSPTSINNCKVGLFFSKRDAELALMKELKERYEDALAERMKAVNELKASIEELGSSIAKSDKT